MTSTRVALLGGLALAIGLFGYARATDHQDHAGHAPASAPSGAPSGYSAVMLDASQVGPLGLATVPIAERDFVKRLRTVGVVALDETKTAHVHTKVKGFVEALPAAFVGQSVERGQVLCAIYSQAVYAAQLEYLSLLGTPALDDDGVTFPRIREAARQRMLAWDVPQAQIDQLEKTKKPQRTFAIGAPRSGTIVAKQAVLGTYVEPGTELFTISDLSHVWVIADVYEADLPSVAVGQAAKLAIEGVAEPLPAKVAFLSPTIAASTRTLEVRFDVDNRKSNVRPGAFVTVTMDIPLGRGLAVPEDAVIATGARKIAFVVHDGHVTPREIAVGPLIAGSYRVLSGLVAGDKVATGAQFLLDSESRLKAQTSPGGHGGH